MPEAQIIPLVLKPGIQRDGTLLDTPAPTYSDGKWMRFQRGRPRKMGGYKQLTTVTSLSYASRMVLVNPISGGANVLSFTAVGISERNLVTDFSSFSVPTEVDRSPTGFTYSGDWTWSAGIMYNDAPGSDEALVVAVATDSTEIDSDVQGAVYSGTVLDGEPFVLNDTIVARGVFVTQPYAVYYGLNGTVTWSNANEPLNTTTGDAGTDRVTARTIVYGTTLPVGSGPGGLLFSLDSVIRMDWVGGQAIFKFTTLTNSSSIVSSRCVVELDGIYYWVGLDGFYVCDGATVKRLPNTSNLNWFFDNLVFAKRHLVWGTKIPRFGEVMWYFPVSSDGLQYKVVVFNTIEQCWYDFELDRTAGALYYNHPMLVGVDGELYVHEYGVNRTTEYDGHYAIASSFKTTSLGQDGLAWTRLSRVEPDFVLTGSLDLTVSTKEFANSVETTKETLTLTSSTEKTDLRVQGRELFLEFESNEVDGDYQMGHVLLHVEAGDLRS